MFIRLNKNVLNFYLASFLCVLMKDDIHVKFVSCMLNFVVLLCSALLQAVVEASVSAVLLDRHIPPSAADFF